MSKRRNYEPFGYFYPVFMPLSFHFSHVNMHLRKADPLQTERKGYEGMKSKFWKCPISVLLGMAVLGGCTTAPASGKTEIEILSYKPEAAKVMEQIQDKFNETHDDIHLTISSPNKAMTILKTRLVREDYPDIVGIGGDINYSNFLDADLFENLEGEPVLDDVKDGYQEIEKSLELIPKDGVYAVPYVANAAGILYNVDMFEEHNWPIPETWDELISLCKTIKNENITPLYFGFKDTWTTLAPWNALAVELCDADVAMQVNKGETTFSEAYVEPAEKIKELLDYFEPNPFAYAYNDAATAFAKGEAAMWPIGSYAIPQILSVNPDMKIGSFVMPAVDDPDDRILNSGVDLQFSIMKDSPNKEAAMEVLEYMMSDEVLNMYIADQGGISAKEGDFPVPETLSDMEPWIVEGKVADFQDHHYPAEMAADALIQTYLLDDSENAREKFLSDFDTAWQRYNKYLIRRLKSGSGD